MKRQIPPNKCRALRQLATVWLAVLAWAAVAAGAIPQRTPDRLSTSFPFVGTWVLAVGDGRASLEISADGRVTLVGFGPDGRPQRTSGVYRIAGDQLHLLVPELGIDERIRYDAGRDVLLFQPTAGQAVIGVRADGRARVGSEPRSEEEGTRNYLDAQVAFSYPASWSADAAMTPDRRFVAIALRGPRGEEMAVRYRTSDTDEKSDDNEFFYWGKQRCGPLALDPGPAPLPANAREDQLLTARVIRNLDNRAECLGAIAYVPWTRGGSPLGSFRPFLSAKVAEIMYFHQGAEPTVHEGHTSQLGSNAAAYVRSLRPWRTVVESFRFVAKQAPAPSLIGRWQTVGFGLHLKADGTFVTFHFGAAVNPLPERRGKYVVREGRISFSFTDGLPNASLPASCPLRVTRDELTVCGQTYHPSQY